MDLKKYYYRFHTILFITIAFCSCSSLLNAPKEYDRSYLKGMNVFFMSSRNQFRENEFSAALDRMKADGINTVFIVTYHYSPHERSSTIFANEETVPESLLCAIIELTKAKGLEPVLKPHIDLLNKKPRYLIKPDTIGLWIDQYRAILVKYASLSNRYALRRFVVGTELDNIADKEAFQNLIKGDIRPIFTGELIYAASFDHFITCSLWGDVDAIGVNAYFNLCKSDQCAMAELVQSWNYWLTVLTHFSVLKGMPVYLTEIGYYSRDGCAINPGDWSSGGDVNLGEQAKAYESLLCQAAEFPEVRGIVWWQWELNNSWNNDSADYTPYNKLAENVIRKYWKNE